MTKNIIIGCICFIPIITIIIYCSLTEPLFGAVVISVLLVCTGAWFLQKEKEEEDDTAKSNTD